MQRGLEGRRIAIAVLREDSADAGKVAAVGDSMPAWQSAQLVNSFACLPWSNRLLPCCAPRGETSAAVSVTARTSRMRFTECASQAEAASDRRPCRRKR